MRRRPTLGCGLLCGTFGTKWESRSMSSRSILLVPVLGALALSGCHAKAVNEADAATTSDSAKPKSSATGDYKGLSTGKVDKGDVSVLLPEVGTLSPIAKVDVKSVLSGKIVKIL